MGRILARIFRHCDRARLRTIRVSVFLLAIVSCMFIGFNIASAVDPGGPASWGSTTTPGGAGRGADPWTYFEDSGQNGLPDGNPSGGGRNRAYYGQASNGPGFASSFWDYADTKDSQRKGEGSYKAFSAANGWNKDGSLRSDNLGTYSVSATVAGVIGFLSDRTGPVWIIPYAEDGETSTVALNGDLVHLITADDSSTPFRMYATNIVDGLLFSIGDETTETTDGLSRAFFSQYQDATTTATYTGLASGPHDAYDSPGEKCRICHAVHRSGGARRLSRADTWQEACGYCHAGNHRHAGLELASETGSAAGHGFDTMPVNDWKASGHGVIPY